MSIYLDKHGNDTYTHTMKTNTDLPELDWQAEQARDMAWLRHQHEGIYRRMLMGRTTLEDAAEFSRLAGLEEKPHPEADLSKTLPPF